MFNKKILCLWIFAIFAVIAPYFYGYYKEGSDFVFKGFLLNPIDGFSYLAKMRQGWSGNWTFILPFAHEPGEKSYLFLYYIFLGHIARLLNCNLLLVFHAFRIINFIILLLSIFQFYRYIFPKQQKLMETAITLSVLGSGLGWMTLPFGYYAADFWVAEAYPFLSGYSNPHFSLGMALMLWVLIISSNEKKGTVKYILLFVLSILLAFTLPFGVIIVGSVIFVLTTIHWVKYQKIMYQPLLWVGLGSVPVLLNQYYQVVTNPILKIWNSQNITPTPPVWDILISFSPLIIFGLYGAFTTIKEKQNLNINILIVWTIVGLVLIYLPFGLQRRLVAGLYIPLAGLAAVSLENLTRKSLKNFIIASTTITNVIVIIAGVYAINTHSQNIYLLKSEVLALNWIKDNTSADVSVLSSPDTGLVIPAFTGRRVIYGHPFETPNGEQEKENVIQWYSGGWGSEQAIRFLDERGINYVFWGPREKILGAPDYINQYRLVYSHQDVQIYASEIK